VTVAEMHGALLRWYRRERRDLAWRRTRDPYAIWLSEVMLQQTRVDTVVGYYQRFLDAYPTVHALAEAPLDDVLARWSGLGYYRRARMLHEAARQLVRDHRGALPESAAELRAVRGIGRYTAGAIASIAFGRREAVVDGNVARVLARFYAIEDDVKKGAGLARVWRVAEELVPARDAGDWNQALMELGATVCTPREPRCDACPVEGACAARARGIERELPRVNAKAKPRVERRVAIVARRGDHVFLGRRREHGIFARLWEPPSVAIEARARLSAILGVRVTGARRVGSIVHVLTHRRLEIEVVAARFVGLGARREPSDYDAFELSLPDTRALSTFAKKILRVAW
jgi:A/G-specific adenine glycosylase